MKQTQGRVSRHSILAYVLGLFPKINSAVLILIIFPHSFQASRQHLITCVHTDSLKPVGDVKKLMFGYYHQDMSCSPVQIFQVFCHTPRKNHLDISYSRLQHNQECRSKNHLKKEHVKVPVEVMSGSKYILILCENKNIYRQRTCNLVE